MRFWVRSIRYKDLHVTGQLVDAHDTMLDGLNRLGHEASREQDGDQRQIILAGQLATPAVDKTIPDGSIVWNLEQAGNWHFSPEYQKLLRRCEVWDYNLGNIQRMKQIYGVDCKYVPFSYTPVLEHHAWIERERKDLKQDIDVVFLGSLFYEPRERIAVDLKNTGLNIFFSNNCYGAWRDEQIYRAKIVLNMHCHEQKIMETLRCGAAMANKRAVVCQMDPDTSVDADIVPGMRCVPYNMLVENIYNLAKNDAERKALELRGYEVFKQRRMEDVLARVL